MFRLREVWVSDRLKQEDFSPDAFCSFMLGEQAVIATGSLNRMIRFYFPSKSGSKAPETETLLKGPILQLDYGTFSGQEKPCLVVLHPNLIAFYEVSISEKTVVLTELKSSVLTHSSYNFIAAHLEGQARPPTIVVQSLDGHLSVIAKDVASFRIPDFFLPGPFTYIPTIESFIFAASDYRVLSYRKLTIMGSGEEKPTPEWSYVFGEQVVALHFWKSNAKWVERSSLDVAIVGERNLAVLTENGKVKSISHHIGNVVGSHAYFSVNAKNRQAHNLILTNVENHVSIYVNFHKVWQLVLPKPAIAVRIVDIAPTNGLLAFMFIDGTVSVGYLGTHDEKGLELPTLPMITEEQLQKHIKKVNDHIAQMPTADHLQIFVNVSKSSPSHIEVVLQPSSIDLFDVSCYVSVPPSMKPVPPFSVPKLSKEEVAFHIDLTATNAPPARRNITINATFATSERRTLSKAIEFEIPFEFFVKKVEGRVKGTEKVILSANGGFATLSQIFPNLAPKDASSVSFALTSGSVVSVSIDSKNKRYRVESDSYAHLGFGLDILRKQCAAVAKATLTTKEAVSTKQLLDIAREHYELRCQERSLQKKVHGHVMELESVQKALISRYEAATPEPLDDLNELLNKTTTTLKDSAKEILDLQQKIIEAGARVEAAVLTFIACLTHRYELSDKVQSVMRKYIPTFVTDCQPGWEECAVAGITALVRRLANNKGGAVIGSTPEFLSSFSPVEDAFGSIIAFFSKKGAK